MTCVVGYFDKKEDCVYLGADSLGSNGWTKTVYKQKKVFHSKDSNEFIIGLSGSFNFQALEYETLLDELTLLKNKIDREYLITKFIPKLKGIIKKYNINKQEKEINQMSGSLIFGYKNQLFIIQNDYSLLDTSDNYDAIGCGANVAMGSLYTTKDMENILTINKIKFALEAAEVICEGVQRPFYIINTKNDKVVKIK